MTDEKAAGEDVTEPKVDTEDAEPAGEEVSTTAEVTETVAEDDADGQEKASVDEDEVVISIGEEPPPPKEEPAPVWVKELRKSHRELQRQNRDLQAKLAATQQTAQPAPVVLGKKPTLEDADYDPEKYETALANWFERKRKADEAEARAKAAQQAQANEWRAKLEGYSKAKAALKVQDYEDAEAVVTEALDITQQGILIQGAENPSYVVYALGKNPKKAKELAGIKDPIQFAFAVAKLEGQLKVSNRKPSSAPEKPVSGTGRVSGAIDSTLEKLRAEAEKTGNYSKVIAYKNQKKRS